MSIKIDTVRKFKISELKDMIKKYKIPIETKSGGGGKTYIKLDYMKAVVKYARSEKATPAFINNINKGVQTLEKKEKPTYNNRSCVKNKSKNNPDAYLKPELIDLVVKSKILKKTQALKLSKPELCYLLSISDKVSEKTPGKKKSKDKKKRIIFVDDCKDSKQQCAKENKVCKITNGKGTCIGKNKDGRPRGMAKLIKNNPNLVYDKENNILGLKSDVDVHVNYWKTIRSRKQQISDKCGEVDMIDINKYSKCSKDENCNVHTGKCAKIDNDKQSTLTIDGHVMVGSDETLKKLEKTFGGSLGIYKKSEYETGEELAKTGERIDTKELSGQLYDTIKEMKRIKETSSVVPKKTKRNILETQRDLILSDFDKCIKRG